MGRIYTLIASTGEGKTTLVRKLIGGSPACVYDVNGEYSDFSNDINQPRCKYFGMPAKFVEICRNKHHGTWCVFEDATGFLSGKQEDAMRQFCVAKRHPLPLGGRNIIFLFHTIGSVPPFLLDMSDYIVLFKTGDDLKTVKRKRSKLVLPFMQLQRMPKFSKKIIQNT